VKIEHGGYFYMYKDKNIGTSWFQARTTGLGDNNRKAFKRVLDLAITHEKKDKFK
jgi:hypothetical protein